MESLARHAALLLGASFLQFALCAVSCALSKSSPLLCAFLRMMPNTDIYSKSKGRSFLKLSNKKGEILSTRD